LTGVSIAWGNVLLVDHGLERDDPVDVVPPAGTVARCDDPCHPAETRRAPGRFRPPLPRPDPTCAGPLAACSTGSPAVCPGCGAASAAATLRQDVAAAVPQVTLYSVPCDAPANAPPRRWTARHDLLGSGPDERDFVVEIDDERVAWLRFGDGECGCAPEAGESFHARYRVGNGAAGNVAAGRLTQLVFRNRLPHGARLRARNPMAAAGGVAPEDVADARLRAPQAFRSRLARAVTADDYAAIVMRDFAASVQRAAAITRASGAVVEVQVAIDARGSAEPDPLLLGCIAGHLQAYRRLGHDLRVVPARQVPLDVALHICVKPGYLRGQVKGALLAVLGNGRAPAAAGQPGGARRGFFHPDALGLGEAIGVSRLLAAALAVEGVASAVLKRLERLFEGPDGELENGLLPIGPLEVARLDNDPGAPGNGQLTLTLEGGR
jgi:predicted phage baseplate assembly protein